MKKLVLLLAVLNAICAIALVYINGSAVLQAQAFVDPSAELANLENRIVVLGEELQDLQSLQALEQQALSLGFAPQKTVTWLSLDSSNIVAVKP